MNKIYRKVWSSKLGAYIAVSEAAKSKTKGGLVAGAMVCASLLGTNALAQTLTNWTTWTLPSASSFTNSLVGAPGSGSYLYTTGVNGSLSTPSATPTIVGVTVSGEVLNASSTTTNFSGFNWGTSAATSYLSSNVTSYATGAIAQTGWTTPEYKSHSAVFSTAVSDVLMSIYSLGSPGTASTLVFTQPFYILSSNGLMTSGGDSTNGYTLTGNEGNGVIQFLGNYNTLSWTVTAPEIYSSFNLGMTNNPRTYDPATVTPWAATFTLPTPFTPAPTTRPINASTDVDSGVGTTTTRVFDGGTLTLAANNDGAFTITANGGSMKVNEGTLTASGVISNDGSDIGSLAKVGAGRLVLSGTNTYTGTTTISQGVLEISSSANLGTGGLTLNGGTLATTGNIATDRTVAVGASNGTLDVASGTDLTLSGVVSGSGALTKTSAGRLVLSGTNTHSGATTVAGGTLQVSSNANLGTGALTLNNGTLATTGNIATNRSVAVGASNGTLDVANGTALTLSGVVSGTGALTKTSAGSLTLSGSNTQTGVLNVNAGTLVLSGSTASSTLNLANGAVLTGSGFTAGAVVLAGSVKPGNSPGTLSVAGDFTMVANSRLETEIDGRTYSAAGGAGSYDRIAITGAGSVFTANGTVAPVLRGISGLANNDFSPVVGDAFRVVTTANAAGVDTVGAFSAVADPTTANGMPANSRFDVIYGSNFIDLVLTPNNLETFAQPYGIQNMVNAARAFDGIRPAQGARGTSDTQQLFNGLYGMGADALARTVLQASGEIHAFALSEARQGWQAGTRAISSVAGIKAERNLWVDASGEKLNYKQDGYASAYTSNRTDLWIGSHVLEQKGVQIGVAGGLSTRNVNGPVAGTAKLDTQSLAVYANGRHAAFDYSAVFSLNRSTIDTTRQTGLSTSSLSNTSNSGAQGAVLSLTGGMTYALSSKVSGRVWVNGTLDQTRADALTEQGTSVTALGVASESFRSSQATLGYTVTGNFHVPDNKRPGLWTMGAGVTHHADQGRPQVSRQMSLHGADWQVTAPKLGSSTHFLQAGLRLPVGASAEAWINLGGSQRSGASTTGGNVGFSVRW